ncbi:5-oxoprolinase subunit PxpB [Candidatus Chlorohelix sp.]|uniref:5-oxoprolinase subunit PxpB n=1 Tax=Candidatus Chlorohelix sp. TaxID=3139201 RepID=UPI0030694B93
MSTDFPVLPHRILDPRPLGNNAILARLTYPSGAENHAALDATTRYKRLLLARGCTQYLREIHPEWEKGLVAGYDSVLIPLEPTQPNMRATLSWLQEVGESPEFAEYLRHYLAGGGLNPARRHRIPVVYGGDYGEDLEEIARLKGLSIEEVIRLHSSAIYSVYIVGFTAGYAYMGALPPEIDLPRIARPRTRVRRGAVALAAGMTGIYPLDMPGGWRLLGYTPLSVFEPICEPPSRFQPGDLVQFFPITAKELDHYQHNIHNLDSSLE